MYIPTTTLTNPNSEMTFPSPKISLPGAQVVTVSTSVVKSGSGLTIPAGATYCLVSVEVAAVRFYNTGDVPTASNGYYLDVGVGPLELEVANLQLIRADAADATVQISYHKYV